MLHAAVVASGLAGLTWELLWQHHASTLIGVSAVGTAITLACALGGMAAGAWLTARWLRRHDLSRPVRVYGALELVVALFGALLGPGFELLAGIDAWVYGVAPPGAPLAQVLGSAFLIGAPAAAMGATLPVLAVAARQRGTSLAWLYGLNTAGAALGVVVAAFALLPELGVAGSALVTVAVNLAVAATAWWLPSPRPAVGARPADVEPGTAAAAAVGIPPRRARWLAALTGLATFSLEVAWFRSLRAAFQSTTESFALMLASVLVALAIGAALARRFPRTADGLGILLAAAGGLALLMTPLVERLDLWAPVSGSWALVVAARLGLCLATLAPPMVALGVVLPWLLERSPPAEVGRLYALNTAGAVLGSLAAAWLLLPAVDFAPTAWLASGLLVAAASLAGGRAARWSAVAAGLCVVAAVGGQSGVGRARAQGAHLATAHRVLASRPGPDATVSVIEHPGGVRELVIDGLQTSGEAAQGHYMAWMGRLPMLAHPSPRRALVIGFGTGQTANAVRREGAAQVDVVELSPAVIDLAGLFASNEGVLSDARVRTLLMDGRAWLRRTRRSYDVITLEPMPPFFAGVNALYSREFYELARDRMTPGAVLAQWLPLHLLAPRDCAAVVRTFAEVFPGAILWVDPRDRTGILLGRAGSAPGPWRWPGLARASSERDLRPAEVRAAVALAGRALSDLAALGELITDDNQHLAYGASRRLWRYGSHARLHDVNLRILADVARASRVP